MQVRRCARTVDGVNLQSHIVGSKLAVIGLAVAGLAVAASSSAAQVRHHSGACYGSAWPRPAGGTSEMVSCGSQGVSGTRAQFVEAVTRPVDRPFLWQLPR
jgi:hypothetical protein